MKIVLLIFGLLLISGCSKDVSLNCSPLEYNFDISKCPNWELQIRDSNLKEGEGGYIFKNLTSDEMVQFCDKGVHFIGRRCWHSKGTDEEEWSLDCTKWDPDFISC